MHCGNESNDNMHTHIHIELQFGAEIWPYARPEKNIKNTSGVVARSDMPDVHCTGNNNMSLY